MSNSQIAVRHPKRGKAHLLANAPSIFARARCGVRAARLTEQVPIERTLPEDRCKTCWPNAEESR